MPPLKKTKWTVDGVGIDGHAAVQKMANTVRLTWFADCGVAEFSPQALEDFMSVMDRMSVIPDVWTEIIPTTGKSFCFRVVDGNFEAGSRSAPFRDTNKSVKYDDLLKALKQGLGKPRWKRSEAPPYQKTS
jgi:hypothetical protein